jgi:hypothetical protein
MIYSDSYMKRKKKGCLLALAATVSLWVVVLLAAYGLYGAITWSLGVGTWNW